jgi:hypothetical protein
VNAVPSSWVSKCHDFGPFTMGQADPLSWVNRDMGCPKYHASFPLVIPIILRSFSKNISRRHVSTMSTVQDFELAALAAGFTIGFGFLTVWEAVKQTRRNRNRLRSAYIYMVWGEIAANAVIVIIGWLFLHGKVGPT